MDPWSPVLPAASAPAHHQISHIPVLKMPGMNKLEHSGRLAGAAASAPPQNEICHIPVLRDNFRHEKVRISNTVHESIQEALCRRQLLHHILHHKFRHIPVSHFMAQDVHEESEKSSALARAYETPIGRSSV